MGRYLSEANLWRLGLPKAVRAQEFEPGTVSALIFSGTGTGQLEVSWPRGTYAAARVRVTAAGAPGAGLRLALSLDAGATYGPSVAVPEGGEVETPARELVLLATGTGFLVGDYWSFSAVASPELTLHIASAENEADGLLAQALKLPLTGISAALQRHVAGLAAESLMRLRGLDPKSADWQTYRAGRADALAWLRGVGGGQIVPVDLVETAPPASFTDNPPAPDKYPPDPPPFPLPL